MDTLWGEAGGSSGREAEDRSLDDHPQTRIKLAAYESYLPFWIRTLGSQPTGGELYILDLFAGPGFYKSSFGDQPGSPIIACRAAEKSRLDLESSKRVNVLVHLRFVEPNKKRRELLKAAVEAEKGEFDVEIIAAEASAALPGLIEEIGDRPTLALLDPDGVKPLEFSLVERLASKWTEVLLSFDVTAFARLAKNEPDTLTRVFGSEQWIPLWKGSTFDYDGLMRAYEHRLATLYDHTSIARLVFSNAHRAIAQGAHSRLGTDLWSSFFQAAADKQGGLLHNLWHTAR